MEDTIGAVAALLPGVRSEPAETLRRTERSEVLRVRAVRRGRSGPEMLIVKVFPDAGAGWVRESGALAAAPGGAPMPRLVAASAGRIRRGPLESGRWRRTSRAYRRVGR